VAISSYDSLVSRLRQDEDAQAMEWVGAVDPSNLKIKLAVAIVAISSIHLLQIFLKLRDYDDREIFLSMAIHGLFLTGILALAVMDRLEGYAKAAKGSKG